MPDLPNVPTMVETGIPGFEVYGRIGIFAPAELDGLVRSEYDEWANCAMGSNLVFE